MTGLGAGGGGGGGADCERRRAEAVFAVASRAMPTTIAARRRRVSFMTVEATLAHQSRHARDFCQRFATFS